MRARDEFISIASHDIKSPLSTLQLSLEIVASALSPEHPLVVIVHDEASSQHRNPFEQRLITPVLEALQAASPNRFRGIRHTVTWDPHPEVGNREQEGVLATADFRAGGHALARMGLSSGDTAASDHLPIVIDLKPR